MGATCCSQQIESLIFKWMVNRPDEFTNKPWLFELHMNPTGEKKISATSTGTWVDVGCARVELLSRDDNTFAGIGRITIHDRLVRSGRLPITIRTTSYSGHILAELQLVDVEQKSDEVRVRLDAIFENAPTKMMRDHSFDPIHDTSDWDEKTLEKRGEIALVLRPAQDDFEGIGFEGLAYHWEYNSSDLPLFYLIDQASWEIDGDVNGATMVSQSSCSDPLVTIEPDTAWTTEGLMHWDLDAPNPVMTHNLPRWASHQAFDFQYKGNVTLIGVYERVGLIRSLLKREPGCAELKCFDKHIDDETGTFATVPKKILINTEAKTVTDQRNLWTWIMDEVHKRARGEFGLREEPMVPMVSHNYWRNFTVDTYDKDLLPATEAIGARAVYLDHLKKSAMTDNTPHPGKFSWNMCCSHEYEIAPELGGNEGVRRLIDKASKRNIRVMSWTNNEQALSSPLNSVEHDKKSWYILMEDTRLKYGGAYSSVMSFMNTANDDMRSYFIDSHKKIKDESGLDAFMFDSFYNMGFMPVSYANGKPHTIWRQTLQMIKELQDAGIKFCIESFGPFGQVMHGCPRSYSIDRAWVVYKICLGNDYTTVPTGKAYDDPRAAEGAAIYYLLAHMTHPVMQLFKDDKRIDERWGEVHRQAMDDYHEVLPKLSRRFLQEDDQGVLWHDADKTCATLFNFVDRELALPGRVYDLTERRELPGGKAYDLKSCHTYTIEHDVLPVSVLESANA